MVIEMVDGEPPYYSRNQLMVFMLYSMAYYLSKLFDPYMILYVYVLVDVIINSS